MLEDSLKEQFSSKLFAIGAVKFGNFTLTSGKGSSYYIDLRSIPSYPEFFRSTVGIYEDEAGKIGFSKFDVVAGIPTSGLIYGSMLAYNLGKPFVYVRRDVKGWGEGKTVEGIIAKGASVLLVDDLITTGKSIVETAQTVRTEGGKVIGVVVLVDREEGGEAKLAAEGIKLQSFIRVREIVGFLRKSGKVTPDQYDAVLKQIEAG